jgi:putative ABC transport system substrate-binding protein
MIRSFVAGALALGVLASPFPALSQAPSARRVGFVSAGARTPDGLPPAVLREALRSLGWADPSVTYDARFAEGKIDRLPGFMAELVQRNVEVIVTQGGPTAVAAKRATATIPIVLATGAGDAVATGLIASLAHPGGNITGISEEAVQLSAKRLEILKEAVPKAARIAVMWNADDLAMNLRYREIEKAARILNVEVQPLGVREPNDFEHAFAAMTRARPDAMFLVADSLTILNRRQVVEFAAARRIPAMYELGFIVRDGGLMAYGPAVEDQFRTVATYVDRILKGAKPVDLPVEQPSRYYLTVNLKTAASLGITIPPPLLLRADLVIQ